MLKSWMMMEAEMYGMMPKAKMEARVNAPPVKSDKMSPKPPEPS